MAQEGVIRNFMVALGFKTDNAGLGQMQSAMEGVDWQAKALKASLLAMATGAIVAVRQTAGELDKLYYSSQRIGASVTNINAYGNAIAQLGGSAEGAIGSLESIAEKMRNSPGYESMIGGLGVATRDANGEMRDRVEMMKDLSGVLSKMPAYQANAYAESLGIDQNTLLAMRDGKFMSNMEKYQKIQKELGMNDDLAKSGNEFMAEYRDLTMMTKTGFQVLVMQAGKALIPILRLLNQLIRAGITTFGQLNPQIKETLTVGLRFGMLALVFGGFVKVVGMLLGFISPLKVLIGLVKLLRLAFLASPIGIVLAFAAAIGLLWDDYNTWREGGKSFIDWKNWTQEADWVIEKIQELIQWIKDLAKLALDWSFGKGTYEAVINFASTKVIEPFMENFNKEQAASNGQTLPPAGSAANPTKPAFIESDLGKSAAIGIAKIINGGVKEVVTGGYSALGNIISKGEGNYNSVNRGLVNGKNLGSFETDLSKMTINQILERNKLKTSDKNRMNAVGKYQIIASTMKEAKKAMKLTGNEKFTKEMQERIFKEFLVPKRKGLADYLNGGKTSLDQAQYEASMEWASIPVPKGYKTKTGKISNGKVTYYDENGGNKAKKGQGERVRQELMNIRNANSQSNTTNANSANSNAVSIKNNAPSINNPHKSQVNSSSNMSASNVTIHQSYKTDMVINGAGSPMETANAVQRQQDNSMVIMARGTKGLLVG